MSVADPASPVEGLFRLGDAGGVLGAVVLAATTVRAVNRKREDRFLPAATAPF